jgi:hypothetical protein
MMSGMAKETASWCLYNITNWQCRPKSFTGKRHRPAGGGNYGRRGRLDGVGVEKQERIWP